MFDKMSKIIVLAVAVVAWAGPAAAAFTAADDPVLFWNDVALATLPGSAPVQTRGYAMINIAIHDSVNATLGSPNHSYVKGIGTAGGNTRAAAAQAARDVLVHLSPARVADFDAALSASLALIPDGQAKSDGIETGAAYAGAIIARRTGDGSTAVVPYTPSGEIGHWAPTPPGLAPAALAQWGAVDPFLLASGNQFRPGPPPAIDSEAYAEAYNEVKALGRARPVAGDATAVSGQFWASANGSQWLRIGVDIAADEGLSIIENARIFAILTTGLADTQIAGFDTKYFEDYDLWRPVTAIRAGDIDGNALTIGDPDWLALNNAPAHPSYISTLSALSGLGALTLSNFFGDDEEICLTIGATNRCFASLAATAFDASESRIWGGIHFRFDTEAGLMMGQQIGQLALDGNSFNAVPEPAAWLMMIFGFGMVGSAMRRRAAVSCQSC